jgi:hypothetical protein
VPFRVDLVCNACYWLSEVGLVDRNRTIKYGSIVFLTKEGCIRRGRFSR